MNFLSHYFFDRYATYPERILGVLLPDLLKNANREYVFHPNRFQEEIVSHPIMLEIYHGWYRHVEVDKLFHSSDFFLEHSHELRKLFDPIFADSPVRTSFFAHIALELMLDHLLVVDEAIHVARLYDHLEQVDRKVVTRFLKIIGLEDVSEFFAFFDRFLEVKYLYEYENLQNISFPLINIAKRLWSFDVNDQVHLEIFEILRSYSKDRLKNYRQIYQYIQHNMTYLS